MTRDPVTPRQDAQFRDFVAVLRRRRLLIGLVFVTVTLLGAATIPLTPESYRSVSRVLVEVSDARSSGVATDPVDRMIYQNIAPDIGEHLGFLQSPEILTAAFQEAGVTPPVGEDVTTETVVVKQEGSTPVLNIAVSLPSADGSSRVAQAIPKVYNKFLVDTREASAESAVRKLTDKLESERQKLKSAEQALEKFRSSAANQVSAGNDAEERQSRLHQYETQLELARTNLAAAKVRFDEAQTARRELPAEIDNPNEVSAPDRRAEQERVVNGLRSRLQELRVTFSDSSPEVRAVRAQLVNEESYLKTIPRKENRGSRIRNPQIPVYDQRVSETKANYEAARAEVDKLTELVGKERIALEDTTKKFPVEQELLRNITLSQNQVSILSQNLEAIQSLSRPTNDPVRTIVTTTPLRTSPQITRTLLVSGLLGMIMGIGFALFRDRVDNRIHTLEQIYDASGAMPLGQVPASEKTLALESGRSRTAVLESYRVLRFNLDSANPNGVRSVLVTSASAGEGRAALSLNLAIESATDLQKTILVDGDMRTSELHGRLNLSRGPGLSDVLNGTAALKDVLLETNIPNLLFLPAGSEVPNPLEILGAAGFEALHAELKELSDVVIINSPSLLRFSDGRAMAKIVDSVLYVAKRGFTQRSAMRYCVEMLKLAHARMLGVVLSDENVSANATPYFATE